MRYRLSAIPDQQVPRVRVAILQHAIDTYASETNKVISVWAGFSDADLAYRPHPRSSSVAEIMKHQLLSERRFFAEFLNLPEPGAGEVLPQQPSVETFQRCMLELAVARLGFLAERDESWWLAVVPFFDTSRERIWIFWRRVLHTAHHRTQLTVYLRMLGKPVPSTYGPTADVSWEGADPTLSVEAAGSKGKVQSRG
jgi:uncharacterized damage-inducible protein DinB